MIVRCTVGNISAEKIYDGVLTGCGLVAMSFSVVPTSLVILAMWSTAELLPIRFGPRRRQWGEFQCLIAKSNCVIITFCNFIIREVLTFSMRLCFGSCIISIRSNKGLINMFNESQQGGSLFM